MVLKQVIVSCLKRTTTKESHFPFLISKMSSSSSSKSHYINFVKFNNVVESNSKLEAAWTSRSDIAKILFALNFAAEMHKDTMGKDAKPKINHVIGVTNILVEEGKVDDVDMICASLLHDVLEEKQSLTTPEILEKYFGENIASIVSELSDDRTLPKSAQRLLQIKNGPKKSKSAKTISMCDKIHNLRCLSSGEGLRDSLSEESQTEYYIWTKKVVENYYLANEGLAKILQDFYQERKVSMEKIESTKSLEMMSIMKDGC